MRKMMTSENSNTNIEQRRTRRRGTARQTLERESETSGKDSGVSGEVDGEGDIKKQVLILDYPSVMAQISPLHLRELTKYFEVVLIGRTADFTQEDLDALQVSAVSFYYDYPDAEAREKFRKAIREIVREFSTAPAHYFSSLHWWAIEEATKAPITIIPAPALRSIAIAIAQGRPEMVKEIIEKFTIRIL
jgi:hypothetical protein